MFDKIYSGIKCPIQDPTKKDDNDQCPNNIIYHNLSKHPLRSSSIMNYFICLST